MQRTVKIKLPANNALLKTIDIGNKIFEKILKVGYANKTYNKKILHKFTYKKLRKMYPSFPSALLQTVRDVASEALKATKLKKQIRIKKKSSLRLDKRNLRVNLKNRKISISSIQGRIKMDFSENPQTKKYEDWSAHAATLCFKNGNLYLNIVIEKEAPKIGKFQKQDVLGIDRGINNILACSNNQFFNSKHLRAVKGRYQYLRKVLQSKGTSSARRKLKKTGGMEKRFVSDTNHCLSKAIAESDYQIFVLEDLHRMTEKMKGRRFNKKLGNWSFRQFETFLRYKGEALEKIVLNVNPKYTSQTCSKCGHREKNNRKLSRFACKKCKFELHADLNAARNIAQLGISELGRLFVNQPNVTPYEEIENFREQLQANHLEKRSFSRDGSSKELPEF
ncbi:MAG: transposase, partial [archaeon]